MGGDGAIGPTRPLPCRTDEGKVMTTPFEKQMQVTPAGDGRYTIDLDPLWNCPASMHGGTAASVVASAMAAELGADKALRTISCVYAAPVGPGPVEIEVKVLRAGRSVSQVQATMCNVGAAAGLTAIAAFGSERATFEYTDVVMPEVSPPGEPRPLDTPRNPDTWNPYWEPGAVNLRRVLGSTGPDDWVPSSLNGCWLRFDQPPMREDGTLDPLAVVAFGDVMPSAVNERMGWDPERPPSTSVSADYSVHLVAPARSEWLLSVNRCHGVSEGYASVESALWDEHGTFVGWATGVLILLFPEGPPPDNKRRPLR